MEFRENAVEVLGATDILVSPFLIPHFARSVIEAAAMGIPSIATDVGSHAEVILDGRTGLLYRDEQGFQDAIVNLAENSRRRVELGEAARVLALERYDAVHYARTVERLYEDPIPETRTAGKRALA